MGYRLYGEANLVSDYAIQGLAAGDNAAQIIDLLAGSLCCEQYVSSPVGEPEPKDTQYLGVSGNYTVYFAQGVQIIARRPVSLETRNDIDLELFRLDILQDGALAPDAVKTIEAMLTNNLSDRHTDGLSSILGDTVADLGIYVRSAVLSATSRALTSAWRCKTTTTPLWPGQWRLFRWSVRRSPSNTAPWAGAARRSPSIKWTQAASA